MNKPKHTPGPWKLGSTFNEDILVQSEYFKIARLCDDAERLTTDGKDATKANARLIAAAPELLEEIWHELICLGREGANADVNHPKRKDWERKRALIEKAAGHTTPDKATGGAE